MEPGYPSDRSEQTSCAMRPSGPAGRNGRPVDSFLVWEGRRPQSAGRLITGKKVGPRAAAPAGRNSTGVGAIVAWSCRHSPPSHTCRLLRGGLGGEVKRQDFGRNDSCAPSKHSSISRIDATPKAVMLAKRKSRALGQGLWVLFLSWGERLPFPRKAPLRLSRKVTDWTSFCLSSSPGRSGLRSQRGERQSPLAAGCLQE